ncbi:MAG TPA: ABC transporter ATP-binding protein [Verrucomicrobiae bacterium]|nr:ABC transporter ATP-binding protein [Verrucomicrobiae bacterium]
MLIRLLRRQLRPYRRPVGLVVGLLTVQTAANLYLPTLNADIINHGVVTGNISYIWAVGGVMLGLTIVVAIVSIVAVYWASRIAMGVGRDVRSGVFEQVQRLSAREMNQFGTASLITRNTNDVQQLQLFLQVALTIMVIAPIMSVGGVIMAITEGATLALLLVVIVPLMAVVIGSLLWLAVPLFRRMQPKIDRINRVLLEQITGVRVVRAFGRVDYEEHRFADANQDLTATALRVNRFFALALPALLTIMNLSSVAVLWFGGHLVGGGSLPIGNLTAFLQYITQILFAVMMAVMIALLLPRAMASAERITAVLQVTPSITDPPAPVRPDSEPGEVELRGVSFGYPGGDRAVLTDLSVVLPPGQTTAIIGGTGAGKTTLLGLLARYYDPTQGAVLVDGVDVRERALEELWAGIGLVPQTAYLFQGTVASNLRMGRPNAPDEELWRALDVAQAHAFVAAMPGGLEAVVDQGGTNVSGGQRQRLSIARAVLKRPRIYLLDDCFSALDAATDARVRAALRQEARGATMVIVSQRVSTILGADRILVMDDGVIAGAGSHADLLVSCPPYREIVASQLGAGAVA